jgi:hypothetical protein
LLGVLGERGGTGALTVHARGYVGTEWYYVCREKYGCRVLEYCKALVVLSATVGVMKKYRYTGSGGLCAVRGVLREPKRASRQ